MGNLILATVVLSGICGSSEQNYQTEILIYDQHKQKTLLTLVGNQVSIVQVDPLEFNL